MAPITVLGQGQGSGRFAAVTLTEDQPDDTTVVVLAVGSSEGNPFWDMGPVVDCDDSVGGTYALAISGLWNIGTIRMDLGSGANKQNILFGPSCRRTGGPQLVAGDTITPEFQDINPIEVYATVVLAIPGGLGARASDPDEFPDVTYGGLSTTQGNVTLMYTAEEFAFTPTAFVDGSADPPEGFSISIGVSTGGGVVPFHSEAEVLASVSTSEFTFDVWAIYDLQEDETFEPGASAFGDEGMVNYQLGQSTQSVGPDDPVVGEPIRFGEAGPWRFLVTDLETETMTLLDRLASNRQVIFTLNAPCRMSGSVPSDNPEIFLETGDGDPLLAEGSRLLYCFRRENDVASSDSPIWVIRAAGIILVVDDSGGPDVPITDFEAFDPWQLWYRRPIRDSEGALPGEGGLSFNAAGSAIAEQLIAFSELVDGTTHLDLLTGTIETTDVVEINFQQGMSLGEAMDALCETGTMDIVIDPVYDPIDKPGIVGQLNIWNRAGGIRREAIFAWDKPSRSLVDLDRQKDGRERANKVQYYVGQGGPPVPLKSAAGSVAKYGPYWEQQFFPSQEEASAVEGFAAQQIRFRQHGLTTYTMSPAPERSPVPLADYHLGDEVPIYASGRLREPVMTLKRIYSIPLVIGNDQMEAPASIVIADDEDFE